MTLDAAFDLLAFVMQKETITLYLAKGDPQRLRIATIANWDAKAFGASRSDLKDLLTRAEMSWAGLYILLGENEKSGKQTAYIGMAKALRNRLTNHGDKEWTRAVVFAGENLHEGHAKYLEGCLLKEAKKVGTFDVTNDKASGSPLPEHERANMETFLSKMRLILPVLDCDLLVSALPQTNEGEPKLTGSVRGLVAHGQRTPKGFVVFAGSQASKHYRASAPEFMRNAREKLIEEKKLVAEPSCYRFAFNCEFSSPSAAAVAICGGHCNGLNWWHDKDGRTLKELEAA